MISTYQLRKGLRDSIRNTEQGIALLRSVGNTAEAQKLEELLDELRQEVKEIYGGFKIEERRY